MVKKASETKDFNDILRSQYFVAIQRQDFIIFAALISIRINRIYADYRVCS